MANKEKEHQLDLEEIYCNTPGVYHQLSSGFELKHGSLSGDEDVKVKPMEVSLNLNLDVAPCFAYM
jgi:hypothetical protein